MRKYFSLFIFIFSFSTVSFGSTATYYVTSNLNLINLPNNCNGYYGFGSSGFNWSDGIPAGSTINSVNVQFYVGVECNSGQTYGSTLNSVGGPSFSQTPNNCACSGSGIVTLSMPAGAYTIGGTNTFMVTGTSTWWGLYAGLAGSAYAIITVDYSSATISVTGSLSNFGNVCVNSTSSAQSYNVSGTGLTDAITVAAPAGFLVSTNSGCCYSSSLQLWPSGGTVPSTPIYVEFVPTSASAYGANITNSSTGASTQNIWAAGTGIVCPPSISIPYSETVNSTTAKLGGTITSINGASVTERGIYYSTINGFTPPGQGTKVSETSGPYGTGAFNETVSGLSAATHYYFKAFATNSAGTSYTSQGDYIYYNGSNPFQYLYTPYANQFATTGFYTDADKMIFAGYGPNNAPYYYNGIITKADTFSNFYHTWYLTHSYGFQISKIRKKDSNTSLFSGTVYNTPFPNQAFGSLIGLFNHSTGIMGTAFWYNDNLPSPASPYRWGPANANDLSLLSNGDFGIVGSVSENWSSASCPSNMGTCGTTWNGYGYFSGNFGATGGGVGYYQRGTDIFLIRTGSNGDTASGAGNDGFVKIYSIAYCGGGYNPAQPTAIGHTDGNFCYQFNPSWIVDSTRNDAAAAIIEVGASHDLFVAGLTQDYNSWRGCIFPTNKDQEAFVLKTNAAGNVQWCKTYYISSQANAYEEADAIAAVTSDGSNDVIIAMRSVQSGNVELARLANATGNIVWAKSYSFGVSTRPWSIKQTSYNTFIVGIYDYSGAIGSGDMILLEVDANGNVVQSKGFGTTNCDGSDCWVDVIGPLVDQVGTGNNYAIASTSNFSGGYNCSSYLVKANKISNSSGCTSNEFNISPTVTNRNSGGANQLQTRKPIIYECRSPSIKYGSMDITVGSISNVTNPAICNSVLPVELLDFKAGCKNNQLAFDWKTASEQNNNFFSIERGIQDSDKNMNWIEIAKVKGAGNSSTEKHYEYVYQLKEGENKDGFYRLNQTDFNGASETFSPIAVSCSGNSDFSVSVNPNLISDGKINVSVSGVKNENVLVVVENIFGQQLYSNVLVEDIDSFLFSIDMQNKLVPGVYFVTASNNDKFISRKIVVR